MKHKYSKKSSFRKILWSGLAIFAALILLATYIYRDDLFAYLQDPGEPFQTYIPPPEPDYSQAEAWIMRPAPLKDSYYAEGAADVFILTPTLHKGGKGWNAPIDQAPFRQETQFYIAPNYVSPFLPLGRVYAPYYRHAALYTFLNNREDSSSAQQFAYGDARAAFLHFLSENPPERPIILIGYGQGGLHLSRLIDEELGEEARKRLVAAYIIDHPVLIAQNLGGLPLCEAPDTLGCLVSFSAFTDKEAARAERFTAKRLIFENGKLVPIQGRDMVCINPLTWTKDKDYAPARLHQGGIAASGLTPDITPVPTPRQFGAQCEEGLLLIDRPKRKALRRGAGFGEAYTTPPFNLLSEDLKQNMNLRLSKIMEDETLPRRAEPLLELDIIDVDEAPVTPDR